MMNDYPGEWITAPAISVNDNNTTIFVTSRIDINKFMDNPKFNIRVDITLPYTSGNLPDEETADLLKEITDRLVSTFQKDQVAVLTGIYTGDGQRNWIFYTRNIKIFQFRFNQALEDLPTLPFEISAENDPEWGEYKEMRDIVL